RHTRWVSDWSSDVCSSDLDQDAVAGNGLAPAHRQADEVRAGIVLTLHVEQGGRGRGPEVHGLVDLIGATAVVGDGDLVGGSGRRSEERRVGKEGEWRW